MAYGAGTGGSGWYGAPPYYAAMPNQGGPTPLQQMQAHNAQNSGTAFERNLIAQEQQRRSYDSETQRQMGHKKYDVLSGLLGGARRLG
jgi:hypothetical protein